MRMLWSLLVAASSLSTLGCDPSFHVKGTVVEKGSGAGVEGAEVRVTCGPKIEIKGKSGASGEFRVSGSTGIVPKDPCSMEIDKDGYVAASPSVEACGSQWSNCDRDVGKVELTHK